MNETGVVKFNCEHITMDLPQFDGFTELNTCRRKLLELGLIGVDANGIGFGNVSIRNGGNPRSFYITGSGTGKLVSLTTRHFARVTEFDFERNWLRCEGAVLASSESLTHAAVYQSSPVTTAVIHGHDLKLWRALQGEVPATPGDADYGTPAMAFAVQRLFEGSEVRNTKLFVMAGHEGGIVTFGNNLTECFDVLTRIRSA